MRRFFVLFFIKVNTREVFFAGVTANPTGALTTQAARNLFIAHTERLDAARALVRDRGSRFNRRVQRDLPERRAQDPQDSSPDSGGERLRRARRVDDPKSDHAGSHEHGRDTTTQEPTTSRREVHGGGHALAGHADHKPREQQEHRGAGCDCARRKKTLGAALPECIASVRATKEGEEQNAARATAAPVTTARAMSPAPTRSARSRPAAIRNPR